VNLLESVPEDWIKATVGKYCDVQLGKMLQNDPVSEQDELKPYLRAINISKMGVDLSHEFRMWIRPSERERFRLCAGDILVSEGGDAGRTAIFSSNDEYYFQNAINRLRPQSYSKILPEFIYYWFTFLKVSGYVEMVCNVATIAHFTAEKVKAAPLVLPPLKAQQRIAQFLDQKTAQIDGLIEKKRALLERLTEKRQALITRAVTKGLNSTAPMKPSGIDWLGDIPAHWEVKRLSFVSNVIDCKHRTPEYLDEGIPLVSTSEIKPYVIDYMTKRQVSDEEFATMSEGGRAPVQGDIIYSRNVSVGSAVKVRVDQVLCLGQDLCIVRPNKVNADFLEHFLNSWACLEQLNSEVVGATFKRVNVDVIKKYFLLLPPEQEQNDICAYLDKALKEELKKDEMVAQSMSLLVEYRAALITNAVTGRHRELQ
jgi:type I restriction enzyme S subunit